MTEEQADLVIDALRTLAILANGLLMFECLKFGDRIWTWLTDNSRRRDWLKGPRKSRNDA